MLTVDMVTKAMPPNLKGVITQAYVDQINNAVSDPIVAEQVRDNFISYTSVLQDGKYRTTDYLNAVVYVSYSLMNMTNQEAYFRTFPQRHAALVARGASTKDISAYVSAYNGGKLVQAIMQQSLVPFWVLNQAARQKALNVQVELMTNAQSEMVRTTAANSVLTHLVQPKEVGPLINIDMNQSSGMNELKDLLVQVATKQQQLIAGGVKTSDIAAQRIIDVDAVEVSNGNP